MNEDVDDPRSSLELKETSLLSTLKGIVSHTNRVSTEHVGATASSKNSSTDTSIISLKGAITPCSRASPSNLEELRLESQGQSLSLIKTVSPVQHSEVPGPTVTSREQSFTENSQSEETNSIPSSVRETSFINENRKCTWQNTSCSPNIIIDKFEPFRCKRLVVRQSTDGVRTCEGFTTGCHSFEITFNDKPWGSHCSIGVCTYRASLQTHGYHYLLGRDAHSWGWDIPFCRLHHGGQDIGKFPIGFDEPFPKKFILTLNLDDDMPNAVVKWSAGMKYYKQILFSLLDTSQPLFPAVTCCYGNTEVTIVHLTKHSGKRSIGSHGNSPSHFWDLSESKHYFTKVPNDPLLVRPTQATLDKDGPVKWPCAIGSESVWQGIHVWGFKLIPEYTALFRKDSEKRIEDIIYSASQSVIIGVVDLDVTAAANNITNSVFKDGMWGFDASSAEFFCPQNQHSVDCTPFDLLHQEIQMVVDCDRKTLQYMVTGCPLSQPISIELGQGHSLTPCVWYRNCCLPLQMRYISGSDKKTCSYEAKLKLLQRSRKSVDIQYEGSLMYQLFSFNSKRHDFCESYAYQLVKGFGKSIATNCSDNIVCLAHAEFGVREGLHAWKMAFQFEECKHVTVGLGTPDMTFDPVFPQQSGYVGSCLNSWGWDILCGQLYHGGRRRGVCRPVLVTNKQSPLPEKINVVMFVDCGAGQIWFALDKTMNVPAEGNGTDIAFSDLPKDVEFHPVVAFSKGTVSLEYLGTHTGITVENCKETGSKIGPLL